MEGQGRVEKEGLNKEPGGWGNGGVAEVEGQHGEGEREDAWTEGKTENRTFYFQVCWYFFALFYLI